MVPRRSPSWLQRRVDPARVLRQATLCPRIRAGTLASSWSCRRYGNVPELRATDGNVRLLSCLYASSSADCHGVPLQPAATLAKARPARTLDPRSDVRINATFAAGPFHASHLRDGDPYGLANGHAVRCPPAGARHSASNVDGALVLTSDPDVEDTGVDTGFEMDDGKTLRAPDVSVGSVSARRRPGWAKSAPPLALEYADRGRDEAELQEKIADLLRAGTRYVWVVRLAGPQRIEVYEPKRRMRTVGLNEQLTAPGVLRNPVPARAGRSRSRNGDDAPQSPESRRC